LSLSLLYPLGVASGGLIYTVGLYFCSSALFLSFCFYLPGVCLDFCCCLGVMSCPLQKKPNLRVLLGHRITLPLPPHGHSGDLPTEHLVRVLVGRRVVVCSL